MFGFRRDVRGILAPALTWLDSAPGWPLLRRSTPLTAGELTSSPVVALALIGRSSLTARRGRLGLALVVGTVVCLADWVLVEDLGFLGRIGTDPNSMVPIACCPWPVISLSPRRSYREPGTDAASTLPGPLLAQEVATAIPSEVAVTRASARVLAPSLRRMASTWWSTVRTETTSRSAIWPLCKPSFTSASTSISRAVSPSGSGGW